MKVLKTIGSEDILNIKDKLDYLYHNEPDITLWCIEKNETKKKYKAKIVGIYNKFVSIERLINKYYEEINIQYGELLNDNFTIDELNKELK